MDEVYPLNRKVFVTTKIPNPALCILTARIAKIRVWPDDAPPPKEVIIEEARDIDGLICLLTDSIDAEVINASKNLRVISQIAVGYDNIDVKAATRRGIHVTNTPGVLTETTADFAWALLMAVARRVAEADKYVRRGKWKIPWGLTTMLGSDVYGKTIGIIGLGRIGSAIARRARGFNMRILYHDHIRRPKLEKEVKAEYAGFATLLENADFVTLHTPLTDETRHIIGERELSIMKKTAYLINTSRGPIVDEAALHTALREKWIAGAALDVFEREPVESDNPLLKLENVVVAPHMASASTETRTKMAIMAAENLISVLEGKTSPNLINTDVLNIHTH